MEERINKDTASTKGWELVRKNLDYFENFVGEGINPDIQGLIAGLITSTVSEYEGIRSFGVNSRRSFSEYYHISLNDAGSKKDEIIVGNGMLIDLEIKRNQLGSRDNYSNFHINDLGHNRSSERAKLITKGVLIQGYNIPIDVANIVLKDFEKVSHKNRNKVMIAYGKSCDLVECYSFHEKSAREEIRKREPPWRGINENAVWVYKGKDNGRKIFANAHSCDEGEISKVYMTIRVERPGIRYNFDGDKIK